MTEKSQLVINEREPSHKDGLFIDAMEYVWWAYMGKWGWGRSTPMDQKIYRPHGHFGTQPLGKEFQPTSKLCFDGIEMMLHFI